MTNKVKLKFPFLQFSTEVLEWASTSVNKEPEKCKRMGTTNTGVQAECI